jgi:hypothetical protein
LAVETKPAKCADQGKECLCWGNVFYGRSQLPGVAKVGFEELLDEPYFAKKSTGSIQCDDKVFGDPTPGFDK